MRPHYTMTGTALVAAALLLGVAGYHYTEGLSWLDALLNASMILGGMGPVDVLHSWEGKVFASFYALFSCFIMLGLISILLAPAMHKALKRYHNDPHNSR